MPVSLLTPFLLIFPGILLGMLIRLFLIRAHREDLVPLIRRRLQIGIMAGLNPIGFVIALWVLDTSDLSIFYRLPLVGLAALVAGYCWGTLGSKLMRLEPLQAGVWRSSASFTNLGNIGGIVVFAILGEAGYALIPFYKLTEELWYYGVVFPAARRDSERVHGAHGVQQASHPLAFLRDPFFLIAMAAIIVGMSLNLSGLERPRFLANVNSFLIPVTTLGLLASIGISLQLTKLGPYIKKALALDLVKFILTPLVTCAVAVVFGIRPDTSPVIFSAVLILSSMPPAFLSLVPPSLYQLDLDFANACWLIATASLVVVVPVLWFVTSLIMA